MVNITCAAKKLSYLPLRRRFQRRQHAFVPQRSFHSRPISAASLCALSNPYGHFWRYSLLSLWFSRVHLPASRPSAQLCFLRFSRLSPLRYHEGSDFCAAHLRPRSPRLLTTSSCRSISNHVGCLVIAYHQASVTSAFRASPFGVAGSPQLPAESSSFAYGPTVRLRLLATPPRGRRSYLQLRSCGFLRRGLSPC